MTSNGVCAMTLAASTRRSASSFGQTYSRIVMMPPTSPTTNAMKTCWSFDWAVRSITPRVCRPDSILRAVLGSIGPEPELLIGSG